jgi:DNA-binding transcriptional LysR family regulator
MTQPTVGRQIAALETSLGVSLFTRSVDGLAPTEAGSLWLAPAEAMFAAAESARRALSAGAQEERGTVRITALTNRNEDLLRGDADMAVRMVRPTQDSLLAKRIGRSFSARLDRLRPRPALCPTVGRVGAGDWCRYVFLQIGQ